MMQALWYAIVDLETREPRGMYAEVEGENVFLYFSYFPNQSWQHDPYCIRFTGIGGMPDDDAVRLSVEEADRLAEMLGTSRSAMWEEAAKYLGTGLSQAQRQKRTVTTMRKASETVPIPEGIETVGTPMFSGTVRGLREEHRFVEAKQGRDQW